MATKPYKSQKKGKGAGRHVQLPEWLQASEAWATLSPGPRVLYIELKRRYNGNNNGSIILSHRDAAKALHVHRNTVGPWFKVLEERGFIRMTRAPYLGPSGVGLSSHWALDEVQGVDMKPARKEFMAWREIQKPRTKDVAGRHKNSACDVEKSGAPVKPVLKTVTRGQVSSRSASQETGHI